MIFVGEKISTAVESVDSDGDCGITNDVDGICR